MQNPINEILTNKIISVIRAETSSDAVEKATAMINGGLKVLKSQWKMVLYYLQYLNYEKIVILQ